MFGIGVLELMIAAVVTVINLTMIWMIVSIYLKRENSKNSSQPRRQQPLSPA